MSGLLEGKTIMVTGASKGIGKATALLCAEQGANLVVISRNKALLDELKAEISSRFSVKVQVYVCDIAKEEELKEVFNELNREKISVDCLVNNAGIMPVSMLQVTKSETVRTAYETNVFALINACQGAMKSMLRKRKGSIINLSSIVGVKGHAGNVVYGSSKAAVIGITQSLAKELAPVNIRVNAVAPGFINTEMTKDMDEKIKEKNLNSIGMKRFGTAEDVAKVIVFLASDLSDYVTGQVIGVDGGMVM